MIDKIRESPTEYVKEEGLFISFGFKGDVASCILGRILLHSLGILKLSYYPKSEQKQINDADIISGYFLV